MSNRTLRPPGYTWEETEVQYFAAMLEVGGVPRLGEVLKFDDGEPVAWKRRFARSEFESHKLKLLDWMYLHDVCNDGVYVVQTESPLFKSYGLLTNQASFWVGGFYRWLALREGEVNANT